MMMCSMRSLFACRMRSAVQYSEFTLSSGKQSKYYVDMRKLMMSASNLNLIGSLMAELVSQFKPDSIGGMVTSSIPIVSAILVKNGAIPNGFYVRQDAKKYGTGQRIEGNLIPKSRIVIVDDVATSGGSLLQAIHAVTAAVDCTIVGAAVVLDREEGARELLERVGVPLVSLCRVKDLEG